MKSQVDRLTYAASLLVGIAPLWAGKHLPLVDLPQHLHLISVLHRLHDPTTLYPKMFELRGQLTPYLGYYYAVHLLNWLFPLGIANKIFLSAYVVGLPLSLAFLLRSLGRPTWPSLLALPFAYGDSFWWGFINFCSALPLTFLSLGLFVLALTKPPGRNRYSLLLATSLVAVLLFHVQLYAYLGLALPLLLAMTRVPDSTGKDRALRARLPAILAVLPSLLLFLIWVVGRLGEPSEVAPGAPWKAWGPMLSRENLVYKTFDQNLHDFPGQNLHEFPGILANGLRDGSDRWAIYVVVVIAIAGWVLAATQRANNVSLAGDQTHCDREGLIERWRMLALGAIALGMFFALPFDIRGYIYYLNTRYAHLAAPILIAAVPPFHRYLRVSLFSSAACSVVLAIPLSLGVSRFSAEASALDDLSTYAGLSPMIMGLIFNPMSQIVNHPVFLHSAAVLARERGGATNFSFASTPHSPIKYRGEPPPTFPSEWRPDQFDYRRQGHAYDHFLVRGPSPDQLFGSLLLSELEVAAHSGSFWLVRRR